MRHPQELLPSSNMAVAMMRTMVSRMVLLNHKTHTKEDINERYAKAKDE